MPHEKGDVKAHVPRHIHRAHITRIVRIDRDCMPVCIADRDCLHARAELDGIILHGVYGVTERKRQTNTGWNITRLTQTDASVPRLVPRGCTPWLPLRPVINEGVHSWALALVVNL